MKHVFAGIFLALCAMSLVAWAWSPREEAGGTVLVWSTDDNPGRRGVIELFRRLHPEVEVRVDPNNTGLAKVIVQSLAGVGPDLFDCPSPTVLDAFVRSGVAWDCDAELRARGIRPEDWWPSSRSSCVHEGRMYGHPYNSGTRAIWFHKDLFDEAGVPYPKPGWTWQDFVETSRRMTRNDARGRIVRFGMVGDWDCGNTLVQWGAPAFTPEGTRSEWDSPQAAEAMQFMQDLIYRHHALPTSTEQAAMSAQGGYAGGTLTQFTAKRCAMAFAGRWWMSVLSDPSYKDLRLGFAQAPRGPRDAVLGGAKGILVNARSRHREAALDFVAFLHSREFNELIDLQGDGLGSVPAFVTSDPCLRRSSPPMEDDSRVWVEEMARAVPGESSPFVNGNRVDDIFIRQGGLVGVALKDGAAAMRDAAREVNLSILEQLDADPTLRPRYLEALSRGARPAWEEGQAPPWARR